MLMVTRVIIINENEILACTNRIESNHSVQDIINVSKTIHGNQTSHVELGTHMHSDAIPDQEATTTPTVVCESRFISVKYVVPFRHCPITVTMHQLKSRHTALPGENRTHYWLSDFKNHHHGDDIDWFES